MANVKNLNFLLKFIGGFIIVGLVIFLIWFLFPMFIYKNVFKRYFIRQIPYEVEKNIYRLTSDLSDIINTSIENQKEQSLKYISNELNTINAILSNQKFDFKTINEQLAIINQIMVT